MDKPTYGNLMKININTCKYLIKEILYTIKNIAILLILSLIAIVLGVISPLDSIEASLSLIIFIFGLRGFKRFGIEK